MMFADGEEPVGVRVLTYQSSRIINTVLNSLHEDKIQYLRASSFGKLVEIAEKPAFSGRFARFLLSRQLKVEKKHEAWFRFAGKSIRFSLREFSIKPKAKKKRAIKDKPYWPELFGAVEDMSVSRALKMLQKKSVTFKELRIKVACLALISSFFAYPWGHVAFDMLMTTIKKRDEISLSQNTIALKGFALALQLVIVKVVPALTEVVQEVCSSSESESDDEESDCRIQKTKKKTLSPGHAREVDKKAEVLTETMCSCSFTSTETMHSCSSSSGDGRAGHVFDPARPSAELEWSMSLSIDVKM
ncbi:hypothetical protein BRARA_G00685 [Brassica rapa]|uniref:DUF1985 domain-containing protein n=1 Tax=Brassica campestris TaxID=3711 RepID=A0A397YR21_BRACM|nr:hypothetical protein BRARA_G00685 [Brassica rapa]